MDSSNIIQEIYSISHKRIMKTKGAVKALRAKLALSRGGYSLRSNRQIECRPDYLNYYTLPGMNVRN